MLRRAPRDAAGCFEEPRLDLLPESPVRFSFSAL
jgi:hypothetical protein